MSKKLKKTHAKCPKCGSEKFFVHEFTYYKAFTDEEEKNVINCYNKGNGIDLIECADCGADITELDATTGIEFNFH